MAGDGAFVDIDEGNVYLDSMSSEIANTIAYTREFADEMRTQLTAGIENLNDVVGTYNPIIPDVDTSVSPIDGPSFPAKPTFGDLGLDSDWPDKISDNVDLLEYGNLDFEFTTPQVPAEINGNFDWTATTYTSDMWGALFAKVHGDILNGGTGITDAVYSAIVAREKETRRSNQDQAYRKGLDAVGADGFNLSSGQISAFQANITREIIAKDQDALNNITIKDFDLATENTRFAVTTGADLEKLLRATFEATEQRGFEAAKAAKDYLIAVYSENVKLYIAKWEGVKNRLEALKTKVDAITSRNEGKIKIYLGKVQGFEAQIRAIVAENAGIVEARKGEVTVYEVEVSAIAKRYAALIEEAKLEMEGTRLEIESEIKEAELNLSAYTNKASLTEKVAEAVSKISAQAVASALGAINTSLSNSYSGTESRSEGWSHSDSLSEGHSYEET